MSFTIADAMYVAMDNGRDLKEAYVKKATNYQEAILPTGVQIYRGVDPVALVIAQPDEEGMLEIAEISASGFGADVIALIFESHYSFLLENPDTGQPWKVGELQEASRNGKDWVSDALVIHVTNRAGDNAVAILPYRIENWKVKWSEPVESLPDGQSEMQFGSALSDTMSKIMLDDATLQTRLHRSGAGAFHKIFNDPPESEVDHLDCITVRYLSARDDVFSAALYAAPDSLRSRIVARMLPEVGEQLT